MGKLAVLMVLALGSVARADTAAKACDQDPRCYARELALTLTAPSEFRAREIELQIVSVQRARTFTKTEKPQPVVEPRHSSSMNPSSTSE